jgi:radical S-adenosyl methionine domain-containing protein 2
MGKTETDQLVINWHITEACNYRCGYCYAAWDQAAKHSELIRDEQRAGTLLETLFDFFRPDNRSNPLKGSMNWSSVRLNLAGGEPLLHRERTLNLIEQARKIGFEVSIITNASLLDGSMIARLAPHLCLLGISLDACDATLNRAIGRINARGRVLQPESLPSLLAATRRLNPAIRVKINTVVNAANWQSNMVETVQALSPDKWKVLRVQPVITRALEVSDDQYQAFLDRHKSLGSLIYAEDTDDFAASYLMVDPGGRFFQNRLEMGQEGYAYSRPILEIGVESAFSEIAFCARSFRTRYR